jgi:hypothetical protein
MTWRSDEFRGWFVAERAVNGSYRHLTLTEAAERRTAGLAELARLVSEAHRDARERLDELMGVSLDPLDPSPRECGSPPLRYPDDLATTTLQGYLGEVFAGLIAENFEPHDLAWSVPAFLFRTHSAAAQTLERRRQLGGPATPIPGRTGDDALAFAKDADGRIAAWLFGEAKCTHDHDSALINAGHEQLSAAIYRPVDLTALIDILQSASDAESDAWVEALRLLFFVSASDAPPRFDMLVYVCGRHPKLRATWIPTDEASDRYSGGRDLEAVEVHLNNFDVVLTAAYPAHVVSR